MALFKDFKTETQVAYFLGCKQALTIDELEVNVVKPVHVASKGLLAVEKVVVDDKEIAFEAFQEYLNLRVIHRSLKFFKEIENREVELLEKRKLKKKQKRENPWQQP